MRYLKLIIEYDGTRFYGFQRQGRSRTVQLVLEKAMRRLFGRSAKIKSVSGRTDAGVHAEGQVVGIQADSSIPVRNVQRALNVYLPDDVSIVKAQEVAAAFHARFNAKQKTYEYTIWNARARSPIKRNVAYHFSYPVDLRKMKQAAKLLIGKHDFRSFQGKADGRNAARTLTTLHVTRRGKCIKVRITGDGFLYRMVRNVVGALLFVGCGKINLSEFKRILMMKDRRHIGPTIPPEGLCLKSVRYGK